MCGEMGFAVGGEMTPEKLHLTEVLRAHFRPTSPIAVDVWRCNQVFLIREKHSNSRPFTWFLPTWDCLTGTCRYSARTVIWCVLCFISPVPWMQRCHLPPYDLVAMQHEFPVITLLPPAISWAAKESSLVFLVLPMNFVKRLFYFIVAFFVPQDSDTSPWEKLWGQEPILNHITCCT